MSIDTMARIDGGYYGRLTESGKKGQFKFVRMGKAVCVVEICDNIENGDIYMVLNFDYMGEARYLLVPRERISDPALMKELAQKGASVSKGRYETLVDTLILQEEELEQAANPLSKVYRHLGWIDMPEYDAQGAFIGNKPCFRAHELIGHCQARYIGDFDIGPYGKYKAWKALVEEEIIHTPVLQLVLIAALSAVVLGVIAPYRGNMNPILHLNYLSGRGKSVALQLAASVMSRPYDGEHNTYDTYGQPVTKRSLYGSWSATDNSLVSSLAAQRGVPTILNELGKSLSPNMTRLVFDLSEGTDKKRMTRDLQIKVSEGYTTTVISCGESSLLDRCKSNFAGLRIRVMELQRPITESAKQAQKIKAVCRENGGFAVPFLAQHIIDRGGKDYVLPIYDQWTTRMTDELTSANSRERFAETFAGLFMATAEIASEALKIDFDLEGLQALLLEYDSASDAERDVSASSYEQIIEECRVNSSNFYTDGLQVPMHQAWGRICKVNKTLTDGRKVIAEYLIRKGILRSILGKHGHPNLDTCIASWEKAGVLSRDKDRPTRSRKIEPTGDKEDVFVFRVFESDAVIELETDVVPEVKKPVKTPSRTLLQVLEKSGEEDPA